MKTWWESDNLDTTVRLYCGDVREVLAALPEESVHTVVTSPPYWGLRAYGTDPQVWGGDPACGHEWGGDAYGMTDHVDKRQWNHAVNGRGEPQPMEKLPGPPQQVSQGAFCTKCGAWRGELGLEPNPALYVAHMVEVFRAVRRVLRRDGTLWLNMGDCYATGAGKVGERPGGGAQGDNWQGPATQPNRMVGHRGRQTAQDIHGHGRRQVGDTKNPHANLPEWGPNRAPLATWGLKAKDLVGMPWRVAFALQEDGWWLRSDIVWCLSHSTRVYAKTQKGEMPMTVGEMVRLRAETVKLWSGGEWIQARGWSQSDATDGLEIELRNGQRVSCTASHRWPTERGEVEAQHLRVGDFLCGVRLPEPAVPDRPGAVGDAVGYVVGLYLAEGSPSRAGLQFSLSTDDEVPTERLREFAARYGSSCFVYDYGKGRLVKIHGGVATAVVFEYVAGAGAKHKHLSTAAWRRSDTFLRGVLMGYLDGDAHYEKHNDRWRLGFTRNDALADDLRTVVARLGMSMRLHRRWSRNQTGRFYGWRGELRSTEEGRRTSDWEVVGIQRSKSARFYDVGVDAPHVFALASGLLTHNSKPNPMPESITDRPTRAHEYLFLLAKSARYFYDLDAIREAPKPWNEGRLSAPSSHESNVSPETGYVQNRKQYDEVKGANRRTVWTIPEEHRALFDGAAVSAGGNAFVWRNREKYGEGAPGSFTRMARYVQPNAPDKIKSPYGQGFTRRASEVRYGKAGDRQPGEKMADNPHLGGRHPAPNPGEPHAFHPLGRNKRTVWAIATQPYPEAHFACVDTETEALTKEGWKRHDAIIDGEMIAAVDPDLGRMFWLPATIHRYAYDGPIVAVEKRDLSMRLTPNHRCWARRRSGWCGVVEAKDLRAGMEIPTAAVFDDDDRTAIVGMREHTAALIGWYVSEGHDEYRGRVAIYQSQSANPQHVATIRHLLRAADATFSERVRERIWRGRPSREITFTVRGEVARFLQEHAPGKTISPELMMSPRPQAQALLGALTDGDGHRRKDGRSCVIQRDAGRIGWVQALALGLGYRAVVSPRNDGSHVLYLTKGAWITLRGTNGKHARPHREHYCGTVWCPSVASGFWLARRSGKAFVTGNTFPEALVEPCVLAGTSEGGACSKCGTPWVHRVAAEGGTIGKAWHDHKEDLAVGQRVKDDGTYRRVDLGYEPGCACGDAPKPSVVLDPFAGSGTALLVAQRLGRSAVGIEVNPKYCELARRRIEPRHSQTRLAFR